MTPPFTRILRDMPAMTPFVGPETLERRRGARFALRLGANESAFGLSPKARAALAAEIDRANWYCDPEHWELRSALAAQYDVKPENIVVAEGIDGVLGIVVRAFTEPGDTIVTSAGAYPTFNYHVLGYGGRLDFVPYREDCHNDLEALAARARATGAKLLYLANPDNPTGTFHGRAAIEDLLARMPEGCLLLLDEAYAEFAPAHELPPVSGEDPRVIRLRTFSKAHGMAGLRVGYGVATTKLIDAFNRIRMHFGVGRLAQVAALASLGDDDFAAGVVREVARGRTEYEALGRELGLNTIPSLTNFVPFDLDTNEKSDRVLALLAERGVFVRKPGIAPLNRFVRITVGTGPERAALAETLRGVMREF